MRPDRGWPPWARRARWHHHRHHRHHHRRDVPARLRRRIFRWFGATIVISGLVALGLGRLLSESTWGADYKRAQAFANGELERVWDDPAARDGLLDRLSTGFDVGVRLSGADGAALVTRGPPCSGKVWSMPVHRGDRHLGRLDVCPHHSPQAGFVLALPFLVAGGLLWAASGRIAHRLMRPLTTLVRVTQELGEGKLDARAPIDCRTPDEVGALATAINDMAARIERQLKEQRMLLAAVSHELRTPLGHLRILTDMAKERGPTPRTFDDIEAEIKEIDDLVGELLARSRLELTDLTQAPLDAADLARRAAERSGQPAERIAVAGGPHALRGDPTLLLRALANLVDNAVKHGGGLESLSVSREGDEVVITALDRGPGLPPGEERRVLEPFYRRQENGMLGLGLSLVDRIARAHGGRTIAENRTGGGARVGVAIPAA